MQIFSKHIRLSLVALSLLLVTPVMAQNSGRDMPTFESFDLNNDGTLTESEMKEARKIRAKERQEEGRMQRSVKSHYEFSRIDSNEDGVVSKKEFEDHQTRRRR
ncbi:hypothetical protein M947_09475 [Sulfurimonas hongkongensis]|uniref:EF-hand domain-containing protein n=1 Tax=Sulfurimonas hongkongensis TaxID=1172190 RepID=T0KFG9_9BACT|nr:EF-hand domain-containing protein [Sulfurimonas hongkongensis]EQB35504.1 hypothetical protein M947_09475 [Sulfurimonas hongkongensis]